MTVKILTGDCREVLKTLPNELVHCVVTSPPYWGLRDYGVAGQIGLEGTPEDYTDELVAIFSELRRVLRSDGTVWLNLGDSYAGSGKGGNPDPGSSKQATNKGSQTVGVLYGKIGETARRAAVTNVTRKVFLRPGSGRADGVVDNRGQRNRDGVSAPGIPAKNLIGIPWRVAFALQADGWYLRQDIIWSKPNPMPESVTDRCTKAHEYLFMLSKSASYYYDQDAIAEPAAYVGVTGQDANGFKNPLRFNGKLAEFNKKQDGHGRRHAGFNARWDGAEQRGECATKRNKRSVWEIATAPFAEAHFATFPPALIEPCILAGCPEGGMVLDPFGGAGTTGLVADRLKRNAILVELNPDYAKMAERRITDDAPLFANVTDGYDAHDDLAKSIDLAYDTIRARKANGGKGWRE